MNDFKRELHESEKRCIQLLRGIDYLFDQKKLTTYVMIAPIGAEAISQLTNIKVLRKEAAHIKGMVKVHFMAADYMKYVDFCVEKTGITQLNDGGLITFDGMFIQSEEVYGARG